MARLHEIGSEIKRRRIELGMTQELLARASGLSRATINELESGSIRDLSFNRASRVLGVLGSRLETRAPKDPPRGSALRAASQTAGVSLRTPLDPEVLQRALIEAVVPPDAVAHIGTLLDEAPCSLLTRLVLEVSRKAKVEPSAIWANMRKLARRIESPRDLWQ
jgi:transcriptional regulator with XRE-family HTH domain